MDLDSILMFAAIGILIPLLMGFLNRSARKEIEPISGQTPILRLHSLYQIVGFIVIGIGLFFSFFIVTDETETDPYTFLVTVWICCLLLALPCLLWHTNHRVTFDEEQITSWDWRGRKVSMTWQEITEVTFKVMAGYVVFKGNGKTAKAHQHLVGLKSLTDMMEQKTSWTAEGLKLPFM